MKVSLIVAMDAQRGIGKNNDLMWHLPKDMQFFKDTTQGQIVVMGRKNYDSIPEKYRPLPNRLNVILTRNKEFKAPNCLVFHSLTSCFAYFKEETNRTVFIIGGGEIYRMALDSAELNEMYITHVHQTYDAETYFPAFNDEEWNSQVVFEEEKDERHEAAFTVKKYTKNA
jgi:dihydrofolate reductase